MISSLIAFAVVESSFGAAVSSTFGTHLEKLVLGAFADTEFFAWSKELVLEVAALVINHASYLFI